MDKLHPEAQAFLSHLQSILGQAIAAAGDKKVQFKGSKYFEGKHDALVNFEKEVKELVLVFPDLLAAAKPPVEPVTPVEG